MIVAGYTYYNERGGPVDVVIVGNGDREHADALVVRAPAGDLQVIREYFAPFVEGKRPDKRGMYVFRAGCDVSTVWWKEVTEVLP